MSDPKHPSNTVSVTKIGRWGGGDRAEEAMFAELGAAHQ